MAHPFHHAERSARVFKKGTAFNYLPVHSWFDRSKSHFADLRHRALHHHAEGIFECERVFGPVIETKDGPVPTRLVAEQHVKDDLGMIPNVKDYLKEMNITSWMIRPVRSLEQQEERGELDPKAPYPVTPFQARDYYVIYEGRIQHFIQLNDTELQEAQARYEPEGFKLVEPKDLVGFSVG